MESRADYIAFKKNKTTKKVNKKHGRRNLSPPSCPSFLHGFIFLESHTHRGATMQPARKNSPALTESGDERRVTG
jgi:hypothetical protein